MNRRDLLALSGGGAFIGLNGCLGRDVDNVSGQSNQSEEDDNPTNQASSSGSKNTTGSPNSASEVSVEIQFTCPEEVERNYISYEYIRIRNTGESAVDMTGFTVDYGNGNEYTIPELELKADETLNIMSRAGENSWADMSPRIWYYFADLGDSNQTSVMDDSGTVALKNQNGEIIDKYAYEKTDDDDCYPG